MRQLAEALRLLRVFHDLSQTQLAERLGISKSFLSEIESGKKEPTLHLLDRYAEEFGISVSSVLFFAESVQNIGTTTTKRNVAPKVIKLLSWLAETKSSSTKKKPPQRQGRVQSSPAQRRYRA